MPNSVLCRRILFAASCGFALPLAAQTPGPTAVGTIGAPADSAQIAAVMANSMRMLKPAVFVLDHKAELALAPEQVQFLEFLVGAERDSVVARQARMTKTMQELPKRPGAAESANSWTGPIDEQRIRDEACQRSLTQVDMIVGIMRDRHAVAAALTPAQSRSCHTSKAWTW